MNTPSPFRVAARHFEPTIPPSSRVMYKGRPYKLLWSGHTKHGERAHLQFLDGSKDFWVDAHQVFWESHLVPGLDTDPAPRQPRGKYECPECGEYVNPGTVCWETGRRH
jgi:hypothetical protein